MTSMRGTEDEDVDMVEGRGAKEEKRACQT